MSYDLNVPWTPTISPATLTRTINFLTSLGYTTLALNHTITADSLPPQISNPIPASFLDTPTNTTLLRRCTLSFHDPSQNPRLSALAPAYDILAVRPTGVSDKAYLHACLSMPEISLISLDLAQRFSFHFKPKPLMTAINRGVFIEICYGQALNADRDGRRNFIGNVLSIVRATKGRGIVISGGCEGVGGVRAPGDVVNLLNVWGLGRERGMEALGVNPRGVVVNEGIKRRGFRGVVDVVYGGERSVVVKDMEEGGGEGKKDNKSGVGKKGKGKRKAED
ncbi:RNase P subunit p30-domain-containing protein, partial [Amylocarpus encephaloides]